MNFLKGNIKNIVILVVVLGAAFYLYSYFFGGNSSTDALSVSGPAVEGGGVGKDLLVILADLRTLKLDDSIFTDPSFRALKNFRVELTPEPVGRDNPFAPINGSASPGNSTIQIKGFKTQ